VNWILEHLQLILVVAGSIAMWLNNRQREKQGLPADYEEDGVPENNRDKTLAEVRELAPVSRDGTDPEQEERVRRIQEEIRRKIAERRGQGAPPTPAPRKIGERVGEPFRPVFQETSPNMPKPVAHADTVLAPARVDAHAHEAVLQRQRVLAEQLRQLDERRHQALQATSASARAIGVEALALHGVESVARGANGDGSLPDDFRDSRALRRALVWREVLGAPVALR